MSATAMRDASRDWPQRVLWRASGVDLRRALRAGLGGLPCQALESPPEQDLASAFRTTMPDITLIESQAKDAGTLAPLVAGLLHARRDGWRPLVALVSDEDDRSSERAFLAGFDDVIHGAPGAHVLRDRFEALRRRRVEHALARAAESAPLGCAVVELSPGPSVEWANTAFLRLSGRAGTDRLSAELESLLAEQLPEPVLARRIPHRRPDGTAGCLDVRTVSLCGLGEEAPRVVVAISEAAGEGLNPVAHAPGRASDASPPAGPAAGGEQSERRRFTEAILDLLTACVITADRLGRVTFANRMALETLGLSAADCLGRTLPALFSGHMQLWPEGRGLEQREQRFEFTLARDDERRVEVGLTLVRSAVEALPEMSYVALFRDLGERRQLNMELRRVERLSAVGHVVAGFAHEVRNPLAGIHGLAELLLAETDEADPRREYAERMLALLQRVERFVRESLEFGEPRTPQPRLHAPKHVVDEVVRGLEARLGRSSRHPLIEVAADLPRVHVDARQIGECLLALLENALDAAGDPSHIALRARCEDSAEWLPETGRVVRFEVSDRGPGIPEADLARIFDPFFTTKPKGTGLGLAIAQALVRENGGRLLVRSEQGVETVFSVLLPAQEA